MDERPTHIVDSPGARKTRCGKATQKPEGLPHVWSPFVQRHIDGWGMVVCAQCAEGGWPDAE